MTLAKIIDTLKMFALKHPNINSAYEGNIYDILNAKPDNKYASVVLTQQSHTTDETYDHYGFVIFYVDRLVDDLEENRVQIQSIGKSMLGNIITAFCNEFEAECENISYQPFTQRFTDETAGVYCTITIDIVKDSYCAERYWDESWSAPIVSIKNVDMSITLTDNGHYTLDYDPTIYTGIGKVDIDVELNTEPYYNDGYNNGYNVGRNDGYDNGYGDGYNGGKQEVIESAQDITITENGQYGDGETLYKTIDVNVVPKINVWDNKIKFAESGFDYVPEMFDFSGTPTNLAGLFRNCSNLKNIPIIDTSMVVSYIEWLQQTQVNILPFDIILNEKASCEKMFYYCGFTEIPWFDTSNVKNIHYMFGNSVKLTTLPQFDFSKVENYQYWIENCKNLESLPFYDFTSAKSNTDYLVGFGGELTKLTNIGGFALKQSCTGNYGLKKMPNLTYESCINQLNALYDFVGNNETPNSTQGKLTVHQNFLDAVGEEISIATDKGWTITA